MQNPFVYGEVVPASAFVNRVVELDRLIEDLASGRRSSLISPRRYGEVVAHQAGDDVARRKRGAITVEVTVSSFSSCVARFSRGMPGAGGDGGRRGFHARHWRDAVKSAHAEVRLLPDPTLATLVPARSRFHFPA